MQLVFERLSDLRNCLSFPLQLTDVIEDHQPAVVVEELIVVSVLAVLVKDVGQLGAAPIDEVAREAGALLNILDGVFVVSLRSNGGFAGLASGLLGMPARLTVSA